MKIKKKGGATFLHLLFIRARLPHDEPRKVALCSVIVGGGSQTKQKPRLDWLLADFRSARLRLSSGPLCKITKLKTKPTRKASPFVVFGGFATQVWHTPKNNKAFGQKTKGFVSTLSG
jgi:hypothetical protein